MGNLEMIEVLNVEFEKTKKKLDKIEQELKLLALGNATQYKLRAEGINDVLNFLLSAAKSIKSYKIIGNSFIPDVEFEFESKLTQSELEEILEQIPDSHVMLETLKPLAEYTGER